MALMLEKTYDALIKAGAPEESARAASAELADHENSGMRSDITLMKWMLGSVIALCLLNLGLLLNLSTRHM